MLSEDADRARYRRWPTTWRGTSRISVVVICRGRTSRRGPAAAGKKERYTNKKARSQQKEPSQNIAGHWMYSNKFLCWNNQFCPELHLRAPAGHRKNESG